VLKSDQHAGRLHNMGRTYFLGKNVLERRIMFNKFYPPLIMTNVYCDAAGGDVLIKKAATFYAALFIGVVSISFGAIFIRLADAPAPVVASLRMIFSTALLIPWTLRSNAVLIELRKLHRREAILLILAGLMLALHFMFWISSLSLTGVSSSVVFVATNPIFITLFTLTVLKEAVSKTFWAGLIAATIGGAILGWQDLAAGDKRWLGDLLALLGAVSFAAYFLIGSRLRKSLSLLAYIFPVYSVAAIILAASTLSAGISLTGHGWHSYLYCFLMAVVCQIVGHSIFNWALKHIKATIVAVGVLGEPVGASILALIILGEAPTGMAVIGCVVILIGIFIVTYCNQEFYPNGRLSPSGREGGQ
jgi:drug/metabolite transporter (DMT)-like permease